MTDIQLGKLVNEYVNEACKPLRILPEDIRTSYIIQSGLPFPIPVAYNIRKDCIDIDIIFLKLALQLKRPTTLRGLIYMSVYNYYQYILGISRVDNKLEAIAYSLALCTMLGLQIFDEAIPGMDMNDLRQRTLRMLKDIFHVDCCIRKVYCKENGKLVERDIVSLADDAIKEYHSRMIRDKEAPKIKEVSDNEIGSQENPFANIDEACRFVKEEERKAYLADDFLRNRIEQEPFVFDGINFKVEWASPYVAHQRNSFPTNAFIVNEVIREDEQAFRYSLKPNLFQRKFLFRGQSQYFSPCKPSLFRTDKPNYLEDLIWGNEMTVLVKSHPLVRLFEHGIDLLHDNFRFSVNYGGLQQHYYNKTHFLDLTSDIDAARFFAVTDYDSKYDEYVVHKDDGKLGVLYYYELEMPGAFKPNNDGTHLSVIGKQVFMRSGQQHGFLLQMPKDADFNTLPHVHKVFFRHDDSISQRIFKNSKKGEIYFPEDMLELHWKKYYSKYKERKIVSLDAVKENLKYNKKETICSITKQLYDLGYHVDNNSHPSFDTDELHEYYRDIRNGRWAEFCQDIYFLGPENDLYREMLLQAEHNPVYKAYFVE